jgi:hypothetical protein
MLADMAEEKKMNAEARAKRRELGLEGGTSPSSLLLSSLLLCYSQGR